MTVVALDNEQSKSTPPYSLGHLTSVHRILAERIFADQPSLTYTELMKETHKLLLSDTYCVNYRDWRS